jgi:flagellar hook-associated protein 3 FlgL
MKISNRALYNQLVKDLESSTEKMFKLNSQISSGKRVTTPSDDPMGLANVLVYRTELNAFGQFKKSIDYSKGWLSRTDSILQDMNDLMGRANELAVQVSSATTTAQTRQGAAEEIKQIRDMVMAYANEKYGNKYLFGGTMTQSTPFLAADVANWQDDVSTIGTTPAAPSDGDRYISTADNHIYQYDAAATSWVDQGAPSAGAAVVVSDQNEMYVFSDGQWKALYQGNDSSISMPIGKGESVQTNIPGGDLFTNPTGNIFMTLMKLEKAMRNNDQSGIRAEISNIESSNVVISLKLAKVGATVNRLDHTQSVIERSKVDVTERVSNIEDLDYSEAITSLQNQQTIYQATLKSASMITSLSLVDYIT